MKLRNIFAAGLALFALSAAAQVNVEDYSHLHQPWSRFLGPQQPSHGYYRSQPYQH